MKLQVFTVYDCKAEAYLPPFYMATRGQAIRAFTDTANDPNHTFFKHPEDYTLFLLGDWEDSTASFHIPKVAVALGKAIEFRTHREMPLAPDLIDSVGGVA